MHKQNLNDAQWQGRFNHQKVILFNEADFSSKGTKLQVIKIEPNGKIEPHYHKIRTEAFFVINGTGQITLNSEVFNCNSGDYLLCKPGTTHSFINNGTDDFLVAVFRTNDPGDGDMLWADSNEGIIQ